MRSVGRTATGVLALAIVLALPGCRGTDGATDPTSAATPASTVAATDLSAPSSAPDPVAPSPAPDPVDASALDGAAAVLDDAEQLIQAVEQELTEDQDEG